MKKNIFIITILVGLFAVSCDDYLDVNTDPNNPLEVTPDLVLPVGLNYTAGYVQSFGGLNHLGNMMMFNWGEAYGFSWYEDEEFNYVVNSTFYNNLFDNAYSSALKQYQILAESDNGYYAAIGEIMKAYHFQILVDLYGDVPYSEALQRGAEPTPAYDDAATIYDDLLDELTDAISAIDSTDAEGTTTAVGDDDTIYGGDMTKWKQFANTLKVRMLTRLSDTKDAAFINAELATINAEGSGYITDDVGINPGYLVEEGKQNPYWNAFGADVSGNLTLNHQATIATQYVLDYLTDTNDPRIGLIYQEDPTGFLGVDQGAPNNDPNLGTDFTSNIGPGHLKSATMESVIFTLAEHNFNLAELALTFNVGAVGTAQDLYEAGVLASMNYLQPDSAGSVNQTKVSNYLSNNAQNVSWSGSTNKVEAIITQKWIATMGITAAQSWFDHSRTGYPAGLPISLVAPQSNRPVRLAYPASERSANAENVPAQPDVFNNKIFWAN